MPDCSISNLFCIYLIIKIIANTKTHWNLPLETCRVLKSDLILPPRNFICILGIFPAMGRKPTMTKKHFMRNLLIFASLIFLLSSCGSKSEKQLIVENMIGRELVIPDKIVTKIMSGTVNADIGFADYKIISYIDSGGCAPCKMKLPVWKDIINELNSQRNTTVAFLMIIGGGLDNKTDSTIAKISFPHRLAFDTSRSFMSLNNILEDSDLHTFLLDSDNCILAVGNPAENPKTRNLYKKIIQSDDTESQVKDNGLCEIPSLALGVVNTGDSITGHFNILNQGKFALTLQDIIPSCDCINATVPANTLLPGEGTTVEVRMIVDSQTRDFTRTVDIYFNEIENPVTLKLTGYTK